jgi:NIPSNAP
MIVEVRIFTCNPGLLPALKKRFKTKTLAIWKKHGIRQIGFWTVFSALK